MLHHIPSTLLLLLSASLVGGTSSLRRRMGESPSGQECRTPYSKHENEVMKEAFEMIDLDKRQTTEFVFDVHFNVVAANMTYAGGWVPDSQIERQFEMLRTAFEGTGIFFQFGTTTRIVSSYWHHRLDVPEGPVEERMLNNFGSLFRKGSGTSLNINLILFGSDDETYGFGLPPSLYQEYPHLDGIYVRYTSLPGGASPVRQGSTAIHEAGHWLALWHTFQDGCLGAGDDVDDTPAEAEPATGCPVGRDSCPTLPGLDPVRNWMDYSAESCRDSFTPGQVLRLQAASRYRIGVLS